jgi:hypothetical protein
VKDQEKADLQPAFSFVIVCRGMIFIFSAWLPVPYYGVNNSETVFQDFGSWFCPQKLFCIKN